MTDEEVFHPYEVAAGPWDTQDDSLHLPRMRHVSPSYNQTAMRQHATNIVRELRNRGFQAYFAGGCVRDMLLGVAPADYDVATDATPVEVMRIFPETYAVGAQFGVVLVPLSGEPPSDALPSEHPNYVEVCLLYTSPSPRDRTRSRMPSSA